MVDRLHTKWTTKQNYSFKVPEYNGKECELYSRSGKLLARLCPTGMLYVYEGYSWDGCTPKWLIGGYSVGVWDGRYRGCVYPELFESSMIHDVLCQMICCESCNFGYSQKEVDQIFFYYSKKSGFMFPTLYYWGVRGYQNMKRFAKKRRK